MSSRRTALNEAENEHKLRINGLETTRIRVRLDRVYRGSYYQMTHRSTILTRVHTSEGIVGEAYVGDEDRSLEKIEDIIHVELAPLLLGEDARRTEHCWGLSRPATFDILRDRRLPLVACASVDTAIWDAVGKSLGEPLWRLWGGYTDRLPMIVISGYRDEDVTEQVELAREHGLAGMKLKVGGGSPEEDALRFRQARVAGGDDFILGADANQAWTVAEALRFARAAADDRLDWFEEPCLWDNDCLAMRDIRTVGGARVTAGQSELSASGCRALMAAGAIDVCNFDASWSGGPTEWRRAAAIAQSYGIQMGHHEEPHIAVHLLAAIPHGVFAECFDPSRDPLWWNAITNRPELDDGFLTLPRLPGLGWELDLDYLGKHAVAPPRITTRE